MRPSLRTYQQPSTPIEHEPGIELRRYLLIARAKPVLDERRLIASTESLARADVDIDDELFVRLEVRRQVVGKYVALCALGLGDANHRRERRDIGFELVEQLLSSA